VVPDVPAYTASVPDWVSNLELQLLGELALAVLLGGAIGLERELRGKPAGLRTNILICMAAVLFTELSIRMGIKHGDPGRIAAQILTGVGFIGAGTILHSRGSVIGLTSAATIWVVTAIGMAIGAHYFVPAIGTAALVMLVLAGLGKLEERIERDHCQGRLTVRAASQPDVLDQIRSVLRQAGLEVHVNQTHHEGGEIVVELVAVGPKHLHSPALVALSGHQLVRTVSRSEP
jgi:putative Mg2+ transporter-C (MgtC) family protein